MWAATPRQIAGRCPRSQGYREHRLDYDRRSCRSVWRSSPSVLRVIKACSCPPRSSSRRLQAPHRDALLKRQGRRRGGNRLRWGRSRSSRRARPPSRKLELSATRRPAATSCVSASRPPQAVSRSRRPRGRRRRSRRFRNLPWATALTPPPAIRRHAGRGINDPVEVTRSRCQNAASIRPVPHHRSRLADKPKEPASGRRPRPAAWNLSLTDH